jgi:hypothetical protein
VGYAIFLKRSSLYKNLKYHLVKLPNIYEHILWFIQLFSYKYLAQIRLVGCRSEEYIRCLNANPFILISTFVPVANFLISISLTELYVREIYVLSKAVNLYSYLGGEDESVDFLVAAVEFCLH